MLLPQLDNPPVARIYCNESSHRFIISCVIIPPLEYQHTLYTFIFSGRKSSTSRSSAEVGCDERHSAALRRSPPWLKLSSARAVTHIRAPRQHQDTIFKITTTSVRSCEYEASMAIMGIPSSKPRPLRCTPAHPGQELTRIATIGIPPSLTICSPAFVQ